MAASAPSTENQPQQSWWWHTLLAGVTLLAFALFVVTAFAIWDFRAKYGGSFSKMLLMLNSYDVGNRLALFWMSVNLLIFPAAVLEWFRPRWGAITMLAGGVVGTFLAAMIAIPEPGSSAVINGELRQFGVYAGGVDGWTVFGTLCALSVPPLVVGVLLCCLARPTHRLTRFSTIIVSVLAVVWLVAVAWVGPHRKQVYLFPRGNYEPSYCCPVVRLPRVADNVHALYFMGPSIKDEDVLKASACGKLKALHVLGTRVTSDGFRQLFQEVQPSELRIDSPNFDDDSLPDLEVLTKLKKLTIRSPNLSDTGLRGFSNFPHLEQLYLDQAPITLAGLEQLVDAPALRFVELRGSRVSVEEAERFMDEHPGLYVQLPQSHVLVLPAEPR